MTDCSDHILLLLDFYNAVLAGLPANNQLSRLQSGW